jgi:acyl-CoA synthetase (AMP-forming)/AMP-acid ligase II
MNAMDPLALYAARSPNKPAFVTGSESVTYAEMQRRTDRLAAGLRDLGLQDGDAVCTMVPSGVASVVSNIAIMKAGLVWVGLNAMFKTFDARRALVDSEAKAVIVDEQFFDVIQEAAKEAPQLQHVVAIGSDRGTGPSYDEMLERPADGPQTRSVNPMALASLFYTSGTTGAPKGAMHDHANIAIQMEKNRLLVGINSNDRTLGMAPTFIGAAFIATSWVAMANGATAFVPERFDPAETVELIVDERVTFTWSTVANIQRINELPYDRDLSTITRSIFGGYPHPPALRQEFEERFKCRVYHSWGASETVNSVFLQPMGDDVRRREKAASIGLPVDGVEAAILDDDGQVVPPGEAGELCMRDDGRGTWKPMLGYYNRPQETADALAGGWLHTNDAGQMDEDGWFYCFGRRGDLIKVSGWQVFAGELEELIDGDPRIYQVEVCGVDDARTGQKPVAWVQRQPGAEISRDEVMTMVDDNLAKFKRLKDVVFVDEFPRSYLGKVQKHLLVSAYRDTVVQEASS